MIACPFCQKKFETPKGEKQFLCDCGAYCSLTLSEDSYLFENEAAEALGLKPTDWVPGEGYTVTNHPEHFMELSPPSVVREDEDGDEYVIRWARKKPE